MGAFGATKKCIECDKKSVFWLGHVHTKTGKNTAGFCSEKCLSVSDIKIQNGAKKKVCSPSEFGWKGCYGLNVQ